MNLTIVLEQRFAARSDGSVWSPAGYAYQFWGRYLQVFDSVEIVARVSTTEPPASNAVRVDGPRVGVSAIPYYVGLRQFVRRRRCVRRALVEHLARAQALVLRVPSPIAWEAHAFLRKSRRPYGVEVVGDPWDVFGSGAVDHPLRPLLRIWGAATLKHQCKHAAAAIYVTDHALQARYPTGLGRLAVCASNVELPREAFVHQTRANGDRSPINPASETSRTLMVGASDVELHDSDFAATSRTQFTHGGAKRVLFIGSLEQLYKAPDILIHVVARLRNQGVDLELSLIGSGKFRDELERLARSLGVRPNVHFVGTVPSGQPVRDELDKADLFVLPSRAEGLPRAMIEAMARALPCIGARVGGIPELLPDDCLVPPGEVEPLAHKIRECLCDAARMARMSAENLAKAKTYAEDVLSVRRRAFYSEVKRLTQPWLDDQLDRPARPGRRFRRTGAW